jgi:hypothetical protein
MDHAIYGNDELRVVHSKFDFLNTKEHLMCVCILNDRTVVILFIILEPYLVWEVTSLGGLVSNVFSTLSINKQI